MMCVDESIVVPNQYTCTAYIYFLPFKTIIITAHHRELMKLLNVQLYRAGTRIALDLGHLEYNKQMYDGKGKGGG